MLHPTRLLNGKGSYSGFEITGGHEAGKFADLLKRGMMQTK